MRKIYITTALLIISALAVAGPGVGVKGGANFATHDAKLLNVDLDADNITGFVGGIYFNWFFGDKFAIQPELLYSQKGSSSDFLQILSGDTPKNKLAYIDIPVLLRWQIIKFLNIHAGPQFSILAKAETEYGSSTIDIKEELKNSDVGLVVGAEANLPLRLNLTARYIFGLTDISDIEQIEIKNSSFQLTLGIRLIGN